MIPLLHFYAVGVCLHPLGAFCIGKILGSDGLAYVAPPS